MRWKPRPSISASSTASDGIVALAAHAASSGMRLTCTIGPRPGFSRLVIRYRADGASPRTPDEGHPLLDAPAIAETTYWGYHNPPHGSAGYCYTAFGLDTSGSIRASATTSGRPASR